MRGSSGGDLAAWPAARRTGVQVCRTASTSFFIDFSSFSWIAQVTPAHLHCADTARGIRLVPILSKFSSHKTSRKGLVAMIEYPLLEAATGKFSESNVLGVGGFGCVYKAVFDGGVTAAVKRLEGGGPECEKEFEVTILVHCCQ